MAERLVGRRAELAVFEHGLARVEQGRAWAVALSGEPGIGKASVLVELERLAVERGHLVLTGRASELESDLPYWVFAGQRRPLVPGGPGPAP